VSVAGTGTLALRGTGHDHCCMTISFEGCMVVLHMYRSIRANCWESARFIFSPAQPRVRCDAQRAGPMLAAQTANLADRLRNLWGPMMLQEASYRVMISGVHRKKWSASPDAQIIWPDVRVFQKAILASVLVVMSNEK